MRRRAPFAWLVVGVLALAGCSEPQQANDTLPTAPATTSAEPTLEPLGPADFPVPDEAREQTEAGALAMATYYLDLINYETARLTTPAFDASALIDLSQDCETCEQIADGLDAANSAGRLYEGAVLRLVSSGTVVLDQETADLSWLVEQSALRVIGPGDVEIVDRAREAVQLSGGVLFTWEPDRTSWIASTLTLDLVS